MEFDQAWKTDERFQKFVLRVTSDMYVLPEQHCVVVDSLTNQLWLVNWQEEQFLALCDGLDDEQFSLVLALLSAWPSFVPYAKLLQHIGIQPTQQDLDDLERVRASGQLDDSEEERVQEAQARAHIDPLLQTLRDLLAGCRVNLHPLGMDISAVLDYGPMLTRYREANTESSVA